MAYGDFAYWYDELNGQADYDRLARELCTRLEAYGVTEGIVADLGCGTGELSLRMAETGRYDMIGVDASPEMLAMFRNKQAAAGESAADILLLCQDLTCLDLYGTIRVGLSVFDTLNHLPPASLDEALGRIFLFLEPGGLFLFDTNTPYKHREILGNNTIRVESDGVCCRWENRYHPLLCAVDIHLRAEEAGEPLFEEGFTEYAYPLEAWRQKLAQAGLEVLEIVDGESFDAPRPESQRWLFTTRKTGKK